VRGKHGVRGHRFQRALVIEPLGGEHAHALEHQEGGVPLVDVQTVGLRLSASRARTPPTPSTISARCACAGRRRIAGGDVARVLVVLLDIGVEQIELDVAAARLPHLAHHAAPGRSTCTLSSPPSGA